ncbi:unnamed protein product, partial [Rangifer tarandus platyrhynchus]
MVFWMIFYPLCSYGFWNNKRYNLFIYAQERQERWKKSSTAPGKLWRNLKMQESKQPARSALSERRTGGDSAPRARVGDAAESGAPAPVCAPLRWGPQDAAGQAMTDASNRKEGFKKCRSATFSIDGYSFTIVANEAGDKTARPLARFSRSKSQNCLWNSLIDGLTGNVKEKPRPTIVHDPRPPEEILADELPPLDSPEALVKTSFRFGGLQLSLFLLVCVWSDFSPVGCIVSMPENYLLSLHLL